MVERTEVAVASRPHLELTTDPGKGHQNTNPPARAENSQSEQFAQPLSLSAADWNLALLLVIHAQLVRTLEPRHDLTNAIDVHQVGAVSPPEHSGIEAIK